MFPTFCHGPLRQYCTQFATSQLRNENLKLKLKKPRRLPRFFSVFFRRFCHRMRNQTLALLALRDFYHRMGKNRCRLNKRNPKAYVCTSRGDVCSKSKANKKVGIRKNEFLPIQQIVSTLDCFNVTHNKT